MKIMRVEKHVINKNNKLYPIVDEYCRKSKNLFNYANYITRHNFFNGNKYLDDKELSKVIKHEYDFKQIGSNSGQQTLKLLHLCWKSYFEMIKDYKKKPHKYLGKPRIPKYLDKQGRYVWVLTNVQSKVIDGYLKFSFKPLKPFNEIIRSKITDKHMQTRFIPKKDHYVLEIVYEKETKEAAVNLSNRIIGIDIGVSRFATIYNNVGLKPIAINGGCIKSLNNYYNKKLSKLRSISKTVNNKDWTKNMQKLTTKRSYKIDYFLHCATKYIVNYCKNNNIDTVVVGYNEKWKQKLNIGSKTNQSFTGIPFYNFVSKLEYKLIDKGIKLIKTEESYTSKASFINNDDLTRGFKFTGKRIFRGLYKTQTQLINADVNGAANIIRKVFPKAFEDGIKGVDFHPVIINL